MELQLVKAGRPAYDELQIVFERDEWPLFCLLRATIEQEVGHPLSDVELAQEICSRFSDDAA